MPARSIVYATAACPISRYGVCPLCRSASIIEFSKCVRRHHVTNEPGFPLQPFAWRNGAAISVRPFCMSTTVPYWSNMTTLIFCVSSSALAIAVIVSTGLLPETRCLRQRREWNTYVVGPLGRIGLGRTPAREDALSERINSRQFYEADIAGDWRLFPEGAYAFFRAPNFAASVRLVEAIGRLAPGGGEPDVDIR